MTARFSERARLLLCRTTPPSERSIWEKRSSSVSEAMALEQKLNLRLSQRLVMTPSLQQAIKLLQMSKLELEEVLTQEMVENPVLEEEQEETAQETETAEAPDTPEPAKEEAEAAPAASAPVP